MEQGLEIIWSNGWSNRRSQAGGITEDKTESGWSQAGARLEPGWSQAGARLEDFWLEIGF
jgi:hypothetical protein